MTPLRLVTALMVLAAEPQSGDASRQAERDAMVRDQIEQRGVRDRRVLEALRSVPRHRFVPAAYRVRAYQDSPRPIGLGQTISQPYVVAAMAEALRLRAGERVLEVGSGSGYAAAVLSRLAAEVYGIELERELWERSVEVVRQLGYANVHLRHGDGFGGWPEKAPFDAVLVSCSVESVPPPLWAQLREGGRLVYPRGPVDGVQELVVVTKTPAGPRQERLGAVRFVPLRRQPRRKGSGRRSFRPRPGDVRG
jgi:protein-L-isoaspartate(D-aspartate) O-methyltransferase